MSINIVCRECLYTSNLEYVEFDSKGICNWCHEINKLKQRYGTGTQKGKLDFEQIIEVIKAKSKRNKYDCIIGISGGVDSSYLLVLAKEYGLRVLAVHYDNTWNSAIASQNIAMLVKKLKMDLITYVVNAEEATDIYRAFFRAGLPELEAGTDLGFAQILRKIAKKNKINYILEGHSFEAEGITPLNNNYFDGKYIKNVHNLYGRVKLKTYPLMTINKFLKSSLFHKLEIIRPLWFLDYSKEKAIQLLESDYDWSYYGGHHLENYMSAFLHSVYLPLKFESDFRLHTLSAQVRAGHLTREKAMDQLNSKQASNETLIEYVCTRLEMTRAEYNIIMNQPKKHWKEFKTYKNAFYRMRWIFHFLAKRNRVPWSFYFEVL